MKPLEILIVFIVFTAAVVAFLHVWASTPVMYVSHSTGDCVKVIGGGDCENPPTKYERIWIK